VLKKIIFNVLIMSILSMSAVNDTITLDPGSVVITKDSAYIILVPPPTLDIVPKYKTNWSRIKDLFL
jgi:hypothetical protein